MKFIRFLAFSLFFAPFAASAASSDFMMAAQLLAAAKAADIQQVQSLVNAGADINFVDSTGVSIVCTALMNNDVRAAQILQMYGADASKCDRQIKQFNNRNKPRASGGLFSGLSSVQGITLAAAGAAVVVGGLLLLTDVFDPGNDNDAASSDGNRPDNNPDDNTDQSAVAYLSVPYSPAYLGLDGKITTSDETYRANLTLWDPTAGSALRQADFNYFRPQVQAENNYVIDGLYLPMQNYLLMMHGYSAFANEYMGQGIFRDTATRNPILVGNSATGGRPVIAGLVTDNGVSPVGALDRSGGIVYAISAAADSATYLVDKFTNFNNPTSDGLGTEIVGFDFSGNGTAMNLFADSYDNALGKIVAGWEAGGRTDGDLIGFVPNGRLGIFRTGGGKYWQDLVSPLEGEVLGTVVNGDGADENAIDVGDTITFGGKTYLISLAVADSTIVNPTITINGTTYKLPSNSTLLKGVCSSSVEGECDDVSDIAIYLGDDGAYYVNTTGTNSVDNVLMVNGGNIYAKKELVDADYKNFQALYNARTVSDVLANVSVIDAARGNDYLTIADVPGLFDLTSASKEEVFAALINSAYDKNNSDINSQGMYAHRMFNNYTAGSPILLMPAGEFQWTGGAAKYATFENYAPLLYDGNLEHMFMTIVAVQHTGGTAGAGSIAGYGNGTGDSYGPLRLSVWQDYNGTLEDASDDIVYMSRKCGVAGVGLNGIDPWCFAAAGPTAEMATAAAAGAVASLKGAFDYMSNPQIFILMALTADGYLLGTDSTGGVFTKDALVGYLKNMYSLPSEYYEDTLTGDAYLQAFADVFGYGLINLERAMTPNKKIYFFDGTNIVSAGGNAYWRAAQNTVFRPSSVLNIRGATIRAPFFDVLESVDGSMSLPRVWENEFAFGTNDKRGLYMGDVLGELKTRRDTEQRTQVGALGVSMRFSERAYVDNLNGLDNLNLDFQSGKWNFAASYQRYLTDGASRFDGTANPVLGLVSNAVVSDVVYKSGNWSFGGRVFSGAITDEGLLENDPTISAQYMPAKLGLMNGGQSTIAWENEKFSFAGNFGAAYETNTLLGAWTDGLLNLGNGQTMYVDFVGQYNFADMAELTARATFAQTMSDVAGDFVLGMSDVYSNAFALGVNFGAFEFAVSQPLAITRGNLQYAYADYDVVEVDKNKYELKVVDAYVADLDLRPEKREVRFAGTYRHNFGQFTDAAFGFIYRVNPNNTDDFGDESIFMMKLSHRLGI